MQNLLKKPIARHIGIGASLFLLLYSIAPVNAQSVLPFRDGLLWGLIDTTGRVVMEPQLGFIDDFEKKQVAVAKKEGLSGIIDSKGQFNVPPEYQKITLFERGIAAAWQDGKCGLLNVETASWAAPATFDAIVPLTDQLFRTFLDGKFGVVDAGGNEILPPQYNQIASFREGEPVTGFLKGKLKGLLGRSGQVLLQAKYEDIDVGDSGALGKERIARTEVLFNDKGEELSRKEYPNDMALKVTKQNTHKKEMIELLRENPEARKPRWVERNFRIYLEDGAGRNMLGNLAFFDVGIDEELGLSLAREVILPEKEGDEEKIYTYLIDHKAGKVLFKSTCTDMVISDFKVSDYARATVDTLWDALIDKQGNIKREVGGNPITNIGNFNSGRAWLQSGNQYGFIDTKGQMAIPLQFELASDFNDSYAIARKGGGFGAINVTGNTVLPFKFDGIQVPVEGACVVKKGRGNQGRWGLINLQQKQLLPFEYSMIYPFREGTARIRKGNKWGLVNTKGRVLFPATVECDYMEAFENGIAMVGIDRQVIETNERPLISYLKNGVIRENGEFLLEPVYESVGDFQQIWDEKKGLARLVKNGKFGFVNYLGEVVLEAEYDEVEGFEKIWSNNEGLAKVRKEELFGYIDHNGEEILRVNYTSIDTAFEKVWADSLGLARASQDRNFGYINYLGEPVIPFRYDFISNWLLDAVAVVQHKEKWGTIDKENKQILPIIFDEIRAVKGSGQKLLQILADEPVYYLINQNGLIERKITEENAQALLVMEDTDGTTALPGALDESGLMAVEKKGRLALARADGSTITKYDYVEIHPFQEGLARVKAYDKERTNQKYGFIDKEGNEVITPQFKLAQDFSDGKAAVVDRINWGYIDKTGNMVIDARFKEAGAFEGGYAWVENNTVINEKGEIVGAFDLTGDIITGFSSERAIISTLEGEYHITPAGTPAYFTRFDEVTPYMGEVAFVKKGERWELTREVDGTDTKLYFNKANKLQYVEQFGERRSEKLKYGQEIKDVAWELIDNGRWRMIDRQGNYVGEVIYDDIALTPDGHFVVKVSQRFGIADLAGNILAKEVHETIKPVGGGIIRLESEGKTGYMRLDGSWIRKVQ